MRNAKMMTWVMIVGVSLASCSKSANPGKVENTPPPAPATSAANAAPSSASTSTEAQPEETGIKTEMRDVRFHLTPTATAHLVVVSGALFPTGKNNIVYFDDKNSFEMHITNGTMSITPKALADIMNNYVFAKADAPLKGLTIAIDGGCLIVKGKLHSKGDIPFGTKGTLRLSDDGRIRVQTEKITALKVPVKGLMGLFGVELASVVNTSKIDGIDTDKNDLLMDLGKVLPPPHIRGKLTGVTVSKDRIVTTFGDGGRPLPKSREQVSYMALSGSRVKFGKLLMEPTDLTVLDVDPKSTLEWDQDHYKEQLQAGYSKITASFGLRAYAKDFSKLGRTASGDKQESTGK
jgi:hypothetical protein